MHIIKPTWLAHADAKRKFEVYSIHISADGQRIATGGLDGAVRIWSTEAVLKAGDESYKGPRQLCSITNHSGAVLAVQWSGSNRYLASGSDDKIVLIYERDSNAAPARQQYGSSEPGNTETWRTYRRLAGHDNDVQDVGWSHDSSILVSVGLDSRIVVWSGSTFERLKRLDIHQSHVKGLTFDPANKYFATASDDRSIKIFRFTPPAANSNTQDQQANFVCEGSITKPFVKSPITTYFRRCSWSPDGSHIGAANATNGPVSSVAIINRGTWDSDINLIGHEGPVEVCSFAPRMFSMTEKHANGDGALLVSVIACAGQDKAVSIWNTSSPRPLIIIQDLATKTISDLAWSPDGRQLYLTSLDGSIVVMVFDEGDIGYAVGVEENEKILQKYGTSRKGVGIPESVEFLRLEEKGKQEERREVDAKMGELMGDGGTSTNTDTDMTGVAPNGTQWQAQIHGQDGAKNASSTAAVPQPSTVAPEPPKPEKKIVNQRVTITKDGRKRVTPMLLSSNTSSTTSNLPNAQLLARQTNNSGMVGPQGTLDLSRPYEGLPRGGLPALLLGNKRKNASLEEDNEADETVTTTKRKVTTALVAPLPVSVTSGEVPEFIRPAVINPSLSVSQVRLAVPRIRSVIVRAMDTSGNPASLPDTGAGANSTEEESSSQNIVFEARNNTRAYPNPPDPTRLITSRQSKVIWQDYLPRPVVLLTANANIYVAACEEGSIHVFSPAGRRLAPPMITEAAPCFLDCHGWWLMVINAVGLMHVWNMKDMKAKFGSQGISVAPVLDVASIGSTPEKEISKAESITEASINSNGNVIICLTNGDGFVYSSDMCVWQRISEAWWAHGSQFWDSSGSSNANIGSGPSAGIIPLVERRTTTEVLLHGRGKFLQGIVKKLLNREGWEGFETTVSIAHLENRMAAARTLQAKDDFKVYLTMYARRIALEGVKAKVEELCRELMGNMDDLVVSDNNVDEKPDEKDKDDSEASKEELLCGWDKRELLKGCLLIFGKHRELQRITVPYARILGIMDTDE